MSAFARKLTLACGSPRRKQLLTEAGYDFEIIVPSESAECGVCSGETPPELVARLAYQKALDVATRVGPSLIVACDTDGRMPRPSARQTARRSNMPERCSRCSPAASIGSIAGCASGKCPSGEPLVEVDRTTLRMDTLIAEQTRRVPRDRPVGREGRRVRLPRRLRLAAHRRRERVERRRPADGIARRDAGEVACRRSASRRGSRRPLKRASTSSAPRRATPVDRSP